MHWVENKNKYDTKADQWPPSKLDIFPFSLLKKMFEAHEKLSSCRWRYWTTAIQLQPQQYNLNVEFVTV